MEDYLKIIYKLQEIGEPIINSSIANRLGIAPPSVTSMIKRLAHMDLLIHAPYRGKILTPLGKAYAAEVVRHHRLIELFLTKVLGMSWDRVHDEAHRLEHSVSDYLEEHVVKVLDDPVRDPHGHLIPDNNGEVAPQKVKRLSTIESGQTVVIASVDDENPEFLRYMSKLGLFPNIGVEVLDQEPFGGSLRLRMDNGDCNLGIKAAEHVWVHSFEV